MPITITARAIESFASYCRVLSMKRENKATWRVRTRCRDEGDMENEPRTRVTWNFVRCKK
jgi:hypothetical protein